MGIEGPGNGIEIAVVMVLKGLLVQPVEKIFKPFCNFIACLLPELLLFDFLPILEIFFLKVQVAIDDLRP